MVILTIPLFYVVHAFIRRLLYVACTRAQALLYVLFSKTRVIAGRTKEKKLSDFVSVVRRNNEVSSSLYVSSSLIH